MNANQQPFEGLLVVSIEQAVAAPLCSCQLAEGGARVIKIERHEGDFAGHYDSAVKGESSYFVWANHGKESLTMDFKQADDASLLHDILADADIFIQNLTPGACERAGFGSPEAHGRIGVSICDIGSGMNALIGIQNALLVRARTGKGTGVKVSLFDTATDWMQVPYLHSKYAGKAPKRAGLHHPSIAPYGGYTTQDNEILAISIQNEREWMSFCTKILNDTALATDPKFNNVKNRVSNRLSLDIIINLSSFTS